MRLAHVSDVHWRGLSRHDEYKRAFSRMFDDLRELRPDGIVICGDIVHSKTQGISPELIDHLSWWFRGMASICDVHVILGNHDGNLMNPGRQDAVSPIISALGDPRIHLYKKSGVYRIAPGFNLCAYSLFDESGWGDVRPAPGDINIALYHGSVAGSTTDLGWELHADVDVGFFEGYDFVFLGDIHKRQVLAERAGKPWIAYAGSTIMQDYGEQPGKGYLVWDIRSRDDFDVEFRPVEHDREYRTVQWAGSVQATLVEARKLPRGARIRVRSDSFIPHIEERQLINELTSVQGASEVVFKDDYSANAAVAAKVTTVERQSLRDVDVILGLFKNYYGEQAFGEPEWGEFRTLIEKYVARILQEDSSARNVKWHLKGMWFDNIFGYGSGNYINFDRLAGITGVFGPNRVGKSSIIGSMLYALFNGSDRGVIKNLHLINSRKSHCMARLAFEAGGHDYLIERQSVRHEARGLQHAITNLNLYETDPSGALIRDLNGEQRTDTEKVIRGLLGGGEDLMLTGIAAQGDMNRFIESGPSYREQVMSRFFDLLLFERMSQLAKEDSAAIKAEVKNAPDRDWDVLIGSREEERARQESEMTRLESVLETKRSRLDELKVQLVTMTTGHAVTHADVDRVKERVDSLRRSIESFLQRSKLAIEKVTSLQASLDMTNAEAAAIPMQELQESLKSVRSLKDALSAVRQSYEKESQILVGQKKSVLRLAEVPCGDAFPGCKYIRDSHIDRGRMPSQQELVSGLLSQIEQAELAMANLHATSIEADMERHAMLLKRTSALELKLVRARQDVIDVDRDRDRAEQDLMGAELELTDMLSRVTEDDGITGLKRDIATLSTQIADLDSKRVKAASKRGSLMSEILRLREEKARFSDLRSQWFMYEMFIQATSKKGIPAQIIQSQLPLINAEIAKIMHGVVDFTVVLERDAESNNTEVYLDYGDSKRLIELGSGMEKMISSLAIRVALQNASSLPRPDFLIIDEGFGTLDETNIAACNRLLVSLKGWFKNIVVISHIDGIKDIADSIIEVSRPAESKDSFVYLE